MSWMDTRSRPSKSQGVPAPFYLTEVGTRYCQTCGRVISSKRSQKSDAEIKYCSERCRRNKPKPRDREIERKIVALLDDEKDSGIEKTAAQNRVIKGDKRLVISCDEIEETVFGRRKNRANRAIGGASREWEIVDMEDETSDDGEELQTVSDDRTPSAEAYIRPAQTRCGINFSVSEERGHQEKIEEMPEALAKRIEGQKRAEEREMVRRAARRAVVFGFASVEVPGPEPAAKEANRKNKKVADPDWKLIPARRMCEALMNGTVVEPSFAKGNWFIRWREEV